jgi:hypothetical protein
LAQGLFSFSTQYTLAAELGETLTDDRGHLIVTGHSLGGGLASAAALAGGFRADTFNAAWHARVGALFENVQQSPINSYYVDWDIVTFVQTWTPMRVLVVRQGFPIELDSPWDRDLAIAGIPSLGAVAAHVMYRCHDMDVVLYGLLVVEGDRGVDMLGYSLRVVGGE